MKRLTDKIFIENNEIHLYSTMIKYENKNILT